MTTVEFNAIQTRIDTLGKETRDDLRDTREAMDELSKELELTRESLSTCQTRCWVGEDRRREQRKFLYSILSACLAAVVVSLLQHYGR